MIPIDEIRKQSAKLEKTVPGNYVHSKSGEKYMALEVLWDAIAQEFSVKYANYQGDRFCRLLSDFLAVVEVDGKKVQRFQRIK